MQTEKEICRWKYVRNMPEIKKVLSGIEQYLLCKQVFTFQTTFENYQKIIFSNYKNVLESH